MDSAYNYIEPFHRFLWKYFVELPSYVESYGDTFDADNCVAVGSLHFDEFIVGKPPAPVPWKDVSGSKKRIVSAPHFSIDDSHMVSTFTDNYLSMLNMASLYPQTTWAIRPHPSLDGAIVSCGQMTERDLADYYERWERHGIVVKGGRYFDLFRTSHCLITDCISALVDYLPTGKPLFHMRSAQQLVEFNDFGKKIIDCHYQVHSAAELDRLFSRVMIDGDDFLGDARRRCIADLRLAETKTASERVLEHLATEFGLR
jgi:hypothetical protein